MPTAATDGGVRAAVHALLLRQEEGGGYANLMPRDLPDDPRDRALLTTLFYGTVERRLSLDYYIGLLASRSAASLTPHTRALLRLGLYQLMFTDRIPAHAAVSETVALARDPGERGLVNAVLRAAAAHPERLTPPPAERELVRHLSVKESMPRWIVKHFLAAYGEEEGAALLKALNRRPPLCLRVNTLRCEREALLARLREEGYEAEPDPLSAVGIRVAGAVLPAALPGYDEGLFYVQDTASQLAVEALDPRAGECLVDLCAAPGGKSFGAAMRMQGRGQILSFELHESKLSLIRDGAARLGVTLAAEAADSRAVKEALLGRADRVICDVPCSGLGVIAKKPDLRYREEAGARALPPLQRELLEVGARYLKPGGVLLYSTCTLAARENEDVVRAFLREREGYLAEDFTVGGLASQEGMLTLLPHRHGTDGFFIAKMRRV